MIKRNLKKIKNIILFFAWCPFAAMATSDLLLAIILFSIQIISFCTMFYIGWENDIF